ncbi:hypothetical protein FEM48_Zijuj07G0080600 [Ziziphus jujuba var. spinosa]|uniref:Beta-amyrin synthase-like n=1 Tax=Ziziphus jujuba var. spinosa TaxID=714518 RepID=A0A978V3G3_ZIZJJ|nr:hypothetical protein FEM48_Zijuj07G0080600 [Ziziphus jujuba var. spinosa]
MWKIKFGGSAEEPYLFSTNNFHGRQTWEYDADAGTPEARAQVEKARQYFYQNRYNVKPCSDHLCRFQLLREKEFKQSIPQEKVDDDDEKISYKTADATMRRAINFWCALQSPHGHWPALNAGVMFYVPPFNEDGGWGLHIEGPSMMMCTVLNYLAMRILGEGPDGGLNNACSRARKWILDRGGAMYSGSWGKTWMAILGVYDWEGSNPMPPEFWFHQTLVPLQPSKMFCYCRLTFMPMPYFYGKRFVGPITPLIQQLREEIYNQPYNQIKWPRVRHFCAKEDNYYPHGRLQRLMWDGFYYVAEPLLNSRFFRRIRESAVQKAIDYIHYEDENSRYITIGCVEKTNCSISFVFNFEDDSAREFSTLERGTTYHHKLAVSGSILAACNGGIVSLEKINGGDTSDENRHQSSLDIKICGELNPKLKKIYGSKGGFCLVESTKGDLLMVCQIDDSRHAFKIVELNGRFKHVPIANLDGHSLFVGKNHSILVLASKYPGCRPNSIYFSTAPTEPWRLRHENNLKYEFKIQEFNLEDGSIRYYSTVETRTSFQNILAVAGPVPWIVPSMKF